MTDYLGPKWYCPNCDATAISMKPDDPPKTHVCRAADWQSMPLVEDKR